MRQHRLVIGWSVSRLGRSRPFGPGRSVAGVGERCMRFSRGLPRPGGPPAGISVAVPPAGLTADQRIVVSL